MRDCFRKFMLPQIMFAVIFCATANISAAGEIGVGDKLKLTVIGESELTGEITVGADGNAVVPLIGQVAASGRNVDDVKKDIVDLLNKDYLVNPKVTLELTSFAPFFVLGQVNNPGSYPYQPGLDVRKAVALSGGFTPRARTTSVKLIRQVEGKASEIQATPDTSLQPGDTLEIERRFF